MGDFLNLELICIELMSIHLKINIVLGLVLLRAKILKCCVGVRREPQGLFFHFGPLFGRVTNSEVAVDFRYCFYL